MEGNNISDKKFRREGILGSYFREASVDHPGSPPAPGKGLQSSLEVSFHAELGLLLGSTGECLADASGVAVAVAGKPYFRDTALSAQCTARGTAAAIAGAYARYSTDLFRHLHGAFACVIVDREQDRVLVAIDRLGQYAIYYRADDRQLAFGSSAIAALECAGDRPELRRQGVYNYLYFHMVPCPEAVYHDLDKLQAAHYLEYRGGHASLHNYWQPPFSEEGEQETLAGELRQVLRTSVENCLPDGGRIGAFLSGGLDSSTVTGVMADIADSDAQAYSIGFSAEGYDEMAYARITAEHFGIELNEYYVTPQDVVDSLPLIATSYDEPFGNSSALPAYFCARMAREQGVETLLAGDGGDEIFAGNERYLRQDVFEHYARIPGALRRGLIEPLANSLPQWLPLVSKTRSYIAQANTPLPDRLQSYNFLHRHAANEIFTAEFLKEVDVDQPLRLQRSLYHRPENASDLNRMLYLDWQITLADNDLRKVSHMCTLAGIEVVYPMLDDALVEFSCRVPSNLKIRDGDLRHFFKQALSGWLPETTINKKKQGFGLPFGVWMQTYEPLKELAYDNLLRLKKRGFINPGFIDRAMEMHQSDHAAYYGELVWILAVFELWLAANPDVQNNPGM